MGGGLVVGMPEPVCTYLPTGPSEWNGTPPGYKDDDSLARMEVKEVWRPAVEL